MKWKFLIIVVMLLFVVGCKTTKIVNPNFLPTHAYAHTNITTFAIPNEWINISFNQEQANPLTNIRHDPGGALNHSISTQNVILFKIIL